MTETNVSTVDEEMDFVYRITHQGEGCIALEVGDKFESSPAFGYDDVAIVQQIGTDVVRKGLQLMGLDDEQSDMITLLALRNVSDAEDDE